MANVFQPKSRHVLPNFRSFRDTSSSDELLPTSVLRPTPHPFDTNRLISEWQSSKSLGNAADLLSSAIVSGDREAESVIDAARFILADFTQAPVALVGVARRVIGHGMTPNVVPLPRLAQFVQAHTKQAIYAKIAENRRRASRYPQNPILYVESARLYSIVGHRERALTNIRTALALAPSNRFVLRSAARLYAHYREEERGLHLLSSNPSTSSDPWLASAELALAGLVGQQSRLVRRGVALASSEAHSPSSLSELNCGLASVLLSAGDRRKSKNLFRRGLVRPNDNSLAQVEWAFSQDRLFDVDVNAFGVERNYEALAREAFNRGDWGAVLTHCEAWFMDMPFSRTPAAMGAHVAVVLEDFDASALFCEAGLVSHPRDPLLQNNLAYALALGRRPGEASRVLTDISSDQDMDETTTISLVATRGLIAFRTGLVDLGRALYREAIERANRTTVVGLPQLAFLNYIREELVAGGTLEPRAEQEVRRMKIDSKLVTLALLRDKVISILDEKTIEPPMGRSEP